MWTNFKICIDFILVTYKLCQNRHYILTSSKEVLELTNSLGTDKFQIKKGILKIGANLLSYKGKISWDSWIRQKSSCLDNFWCKQMLNTYLLFIEDNLYSIISLHDCFKNGTGRNNDTNLVLTCLHLYKLVCSGFLQLLDTFSHPKNNGYLQWLMQKLRTSTPEFREWDNIGTTRRRFEQETNWLYVHLLTVKSELTANSQYYIHCRPEYTGRILPIQQERMCRPLLLQIVLCTLVQNA